MSQPGQGSGGFAIDVNGRPVEAAAAMTVAAALMRAGLPCRASVTGEPRGPLCAMGICFECAATVDGVPLQRTCQVVCRPGMKVETA